ncbi:hypothetical protein B0T24DRAFT_679515 [Lasiosphaeria ovina]|uniref:Uncharacterized protein n=1 Tax=Lasiosphaeria ovina TaxID=92902 RepID=A0AAE0KDH3_9PEZI|nr:hypothetical protein B0T24DRAFT_679515 [Lasiosphaeria ovina]
MSELVKSDGERELSWRFLHVAKEFLNALRAQLDSNTGQYGYSPSESPPTILGSLEFLKSHFENEFGLRDTQTKLTRSSPPRQDSWDSVASTVLDLESEVSDVFVGRDAPKEDNQVLFLEPVEIFSLDLPASTPPTAEMPRPLDLDTIRNARKDASLSLKRSYDDRCEPCRYFPEKEAGDLKKKLARHLKSRKHIVNTGQEDDKVEVFPCTCHNPDGTVCSKIFGRRDNLRRHCWNFHHLSSQVKNGRRRWEDIPELPGEEVDPYKMASDPKRRRTATSR